MKSNVIDYRDIYDQLKDKPAKELNRELKMFGRLYLWKQNDRRNHNENQDTTINTT